MEEKEGRHTPGPVSRSPFRGRAASPPLLLCCPHHRDAEVPLTEVEKQREPEGNPPSPVSPTACPSIAVRLSSRHTFFRVSFHTLPPFVHQWRAAVRVRVHASLRINTHQIRDRDAPPPPSRTRAGIARKPCPTRRASRRPASAASSRSPRWYRASGSRRSIAPREKSLYLDGG